MTDAISFRFKILPVKLHGKQNRVTRRYGKQSRTTPAVGDDDTDGTECYREEKSASFEVFPAIETRARFTPSRSPRRCRNKFKPIIAQLCQLLNRFPGNSVGEVVYVIREI